MKTTVVVRDRIELSTFRFSGDAGRLNAIGEEARGEPKLLSKEEVRVDSARRTAFVAGLFYLITFVPRSPLCSSSARC